MCGLQNLAKVVLEAGLCMIKEPLSSFDVSWVSEWMVGIVSGTVMWMRVWSHLAYSDEITTRDVKFVFFPNSNFVFKIRILFELRSGPK